MTEEDQLIPTRDGADMMRACGCRERLDPDWDAWVLLELCQEHAATTVQADHYIPRLTDHELDQHVAAHAGGRRVQRIMPRDPTKR